jgi:DNA-binding NarL/FixJ family response regulator
MAIKVLIVEDHPIVRDGLRQLLSLEHDFEIGEAGGQAAAVLEAARIQPDVILFDWIGEGQHAFDAIRRLKECAADARILVMAPSKDDRTLLAAIKAGASGLLVHTDPEKIVPTIRAVRQASGFLIPSSVATTHRTGGARPVGTSPIEIGSLIVRREGFKGGRPCIAGTGITVMRVAGWYKLGWSPEEIAANWGYIDLAQVHAAIAYYHANREAIDEELVAEQVAYESAAAEAKAAAMRV